jgi:hypothetical protein
LFWAFRVFIGAKHFVVLYRVLKNIAWLKVLINKKMQYWGENDSLNVKFFFLLRLGIRAASNSAYSGYPELWILRYPAHRYHAVPSPGFEPTTLWLRVRRPNLSATTKLKLQVFYPW